MKYNDNEIEDIEFFAKRLIELLQFYRMYKSSNVLFQLINETVTSINSFIHE